MCTGSHAYIPAMNTAKVELFFLSDGQIIENVFHVKGSEAFNPTGLTGVANVFQDWVESNYKICMSPAIALTSIKVTDLSSESGAVWEAVQDPPIAGTAQGGEILPLNVSVVIKWITAQRGRSFRGRTYVPGLDSSVVTGNHIDQVLRTAVISAASVLWTAVRNLTYDLAVVSYCNGKAWRTNAVVTPIVSWAVDTTIDSQRRRLPGRGR